MTDEPSIDFGASRQAATGLKLRPGKGLDVGTANLLSAVQDYEGNVIIKQQRNAFIDIEQNDFTRNMLTKMDVQYVVLNNRMIVIGDPAFDLANIHNRELRRPMKDGMLSPREQDALPIEKLLIDRLLGSPQVQNEIVYYSVPAEPIDMEMNVVYHKGTFRTLLGQLGYTAKDILEGHCIVFAELDEDDFTGIGISCGGGMFNVSVSYRTMPALNFATARGGDWIDLNVAKVLGIKSSRATALKEKGVDLRNPRTREEQAIDLYYRELIRYTLTEIKKRFESSEDMPQFPDPVDIVFAGGTSKIGGFIDVVRDELSRIKFPIPIKEVRRADDPLTSCARGALVAAAADEDNPDD
ncbi:MAG: cell division protein FtsA [Planctomycetota bacterium]